MKCPAMNGNGLKMIAIGAMAIDHIAWVVFPGCAAPAALPLHLALPGWAEHSS